MQCTRGQVSSCVAQLRCTVALHGCGCDQDGPSESTTAATRTDRPSGAMICTAASHPSATKTAACVSELRERAMIVNKPCEQAV